MSSPARHHLKQGRAGLASQCFEIHINACERRPGRLRHHVPIVEADDRYVRRHGEAHLTQGLDRPAGDLVVAAKKRVRRGIPPREEISRRLAAPGLRPAAGQGGQLRQPGVGKRGPVAPLTQADPLESLRPGDRGDPSSSEGGEVPDGEDCPAFVVRHDAKSLRILDARENIDDREARRDGLDRFAPVDAPGGDHETIDALAEQLVDMAPLARRIVGGVAHEDRNAVIEHAPLDCGDDWKAEPAKAVGRENPNGHRPSAMQALGEVVGAIADRFRDPENLRARFRTQPTARVERLGRGSD